MTEKVEVVAYRSTIERYARLLDGAGAAKGTRNRWNESRQFVTYAASSRALALLETRVHSPIGPPKDAVITVIRLALLPTLIRTISAGSLPEGWRDPSNVRHCQIRGSRWYSEHPGEKMLVVPSIIVPAENLYVIRGGIPEAEVVAVEPIEFDPRLWECERSGVGLVYTVRQ